MLCRRMLVGTTGRQAGSSSEADCQPCEAGVVCQIQHGSLVQLPCPSGHYCPQGSKTAVRCPKGTVRGYTGGASRDDCFSCPAGHFCEGTGLTTPSGICLAGSATEHLETSIAPSYQAYEKQILIGLI